MATIRDIEENRIARFLIVVFIMNTLYGYSYVLIIGVIHEPCMPLSSRRNPRYNQLFEKNYILLLLVASLPSCCFLLRETIERK